MNERKEMIPAPKRRNKAALSGYCKPEWNLLCRIRANMKSIIKRPVKGRRMSKGEGILLEQIRFMIDTMDTIFDDWPEDPE